MRNSIFGNNIFYIVTACAVCFGSCAPRVSVEPPDKPITVNLNVKIDHEVRVKVDKELDQVIDPDSELF